MEIVEHYQLHVVDWNGNDRYFRVPKTVLIEFKMRLANTDPAQPNLDGVWDWFCGLVKAGQVQRCDATVDYTTDEYFLDWDYPQESSGEWLF